jgi:5'-nucleotidase
MKILISNDDGVMAEGIKALVTELSKEHDVYVVAPDRERSAAGHSLTLHTPIRVEELESKFGAKRIWITSGTPGDCVKIGINAILSEDEKQGAKKVLTAAAMTYVASLAVSVANLLRILLMFNRKRR